MKTSLPTTTLGRTQLKVTRLGHGAMEIRGSRIWGGRPVTEQQAETILNAVLDSGINFIDTANDYGRSEEFIGKFISKRRSEYVLATKCGCTVKRRDAHTDETPHVWTRENLFRCLHESLERMKTDYIDIMQLHGPPVKECEEGKLVDALKEMKQQGKVRWIGMSSFVPDLPTYLKWGVFDVFQIPYSALERQNEEWITKSGEAGIGIIIRGGVAKGEKDRSAQPVLQKRWQQFEDARLDELREEGESRTAFLLRYTLSHPHMHTTIVGTLVPEHLQDNVKTALKGPLPKDVYQEAQRRLKTLETAPVA